MYLSDGKTGEMIRRPDGRGGVSAGGATMWGTWADGFLYLDAREAGGGFIRLDRYGFKTIFTAAESQALRGVVFEAAPPAVRFVRMALDGLGIPNGHLTDDRIEAVASGIEQSAKLVVRGKV